MAVELPPVRKALATLTVVESYYMKTDIICLLCLLSNGYPELFSLGQSGRGLKLTSSVKVKLRGAIPPLPHFFMK